MCTTSRYGASRTGNAEGLARPGTRRPNSYFLRIPSTLNVIRRDRSCQRCRSSDSANSLPMYTTSLKDAFRDSQLVRSLGQGVLSAVLLEVSLVREVEGHRVAWAHQTV
jgi:hypothetical protein